MSQGIESDLDKLLATLCRFFANEGMAIEVAILAEARASIEQSNYHNNFDGDVYGYTIILVLPESLYQQLGSVKRSKL